VRTTVKRARRKPAAKAARHTQRQAMIADLLHYIKYNTVCTRGNAVFAKLFGERLKREGFKVSYQRQKIKSHLFVNVIGRKGSGPAPLMICSHLDTVPAGEHHLWTKTKGDPWNATLIGNNIYGLGSADDKGPLVAMLHAAAKYEAKQLKRPLMFVGTFGEESGMLGAQLFTKLIKKNKPRGVIAGEPTGCGITYRHKGFGVIDVELKTRQTVSLKRGQTLVLKRFSGKSGHSSRPALGVNAIDKAVEFTRVALAKGADYHLIGLEGGEAANVIPALATLTLAKSTRAPNKGGKQLPDFGKAPIECLDAVRLLIARMRTKRDKTFVPSMATSNFGVVRTEGNVMRLTFDFRLLPGQAAKRVLSAIKKDLDARLKLQKGLQWKIVLRRDNPPLGLTTKAGIVKFGADLLKQNGFPVKLSVKPSCTEAGTYQKWGVPAIILGPGQAAGNIHSPNEVVSIQQLEGAVRLYTSAIQRYCVNREPCF